MQSARKGRRRSEPDPLQVVAALVVTLSPPARRRDTGRREGPQAASRLAAAGQLGTVTAGDASVIPLAAGADPAGALAEWRRLSVVLDDAGAVPCQTDTEAWWPDGKELDAPSTRAAVRACWTCPARAACLDYAVAAGERAGVWGGLLPDERREMRRAAA